MGGRKKRLLGIAAAVFLVGAVPQQIWASGPETVEIDTLAKLFEPVHFDHAMHTDLVSDCAECHHHTLGSKPVNENCARCHQAGEEAATVACSDCHTAKRFSSEDIAKLEANPQMYHIGRPGLKGAYHQKCLGCHQAMGAPTGCEDCHPRTAEGDAFYRTGEHAPAPKAQSSKGH